MALVDRYNWFRVTGSSMEPTLSEGDLILVHPIPSSCLKRGDIMAANRDGETVIVHRFMGISGDGPGETCLIEKGDNVRGYGLLPPENVVGRVLAAYCASGDRIVCFSGPGSWIRSQRYVLTFAAHRLYRRLARRTVWRLLLAPPRLFLQVYRWTQMVGSVQHRKGERR